MAFWSLATAGAGGTCGWPNCALSSATKQKANPACGPLSVRVPPMIIFSKSENSPLVNAFLKVWYELEVTRPKLSCRRPLVYVPPLSGYRASSPLLTLTAAGTAASWLASATRSSNASITRLLFTPAGGATPPGLFELPPIAWAEDTDGLATAPAAKVAAVAT